MTSQDRFFSKVIKTEGCWFWAAAGVPSGYGVFWDGKRQTYAHRYSYQIHKGEIPAKMYVMHSCDQPKCVNPDHLKAGTPKENSLDMLSKGRHKTSPATGNKNAMRKYPGLLAGMRHPRRKVSAADVQKIRAIYVTGILQRELACSFGLSQSQISKIVRGSSWAK